MSAKIRIRYIYKNHFIPLWGAIHLFHNKYCNVIYYHDIVKSSGESFLRINVDKFKQQMMYISSKGYTTLRFDELNDCNNITFSPKKVLITFDDGWLSNYKEIFEFMKSIGLKYNIFLTVGKIGVDNNFLDWDMVREMYHSNFVCFGTHTFSHINIKDIDKVDFDKEIVYANSIFEKELGFKAEDFCYPYGGYSSESNIKLVNESQYKRIYQSDHIFSYKDTDKIIFGRNGISDDYSFNMFKKILKGYNNGFVSGIGSCQCFAK